MYSALLACLSSLAFSICQAVEEAEDVTSQDVEVVGCVKAEELDAMLWKLAVPLDKYGQVCIIAIENHLQ
jgi:hypothetical protein